MSPVLMVIISVASGLCAGALEAYMLVGVVDAITSGKSMPIARLVLSMFLPAAVLVTIALTLKPLCVVWTGTACVVVIVAVALAKFLKQKNNSKDK